MTRDFRAATTRARDGKAMASTLRSRNVTVSGKRTSIRLEPYMWAALEEICECAGVTLHQFCTEIDRHRKTSSLTAAVRVAIVAFYRRAAHAAGLDKGIVEEGLTAVRVQAEDRKRTSMNYRH